MSDLWRGLGLSVISNQPELGLSRWRKSEVNIEGGLLGLIALGNQATENIDHEVSGAAMPGTLNLGDVLELVNDGFDNVALPGQ